MQHSTKVVFFGIAHKFFTRKYFTPDKILPGLSSGRSSRQRNLEFRTDHLFVKTTYPQHDNIDITFSTHNDKPFTKAELRAFLSKFNDNKAPGQDSINFRLLKHIFNTLAQIFTHWANLCLNHNISFSLSQGEVVYFPTLKTHYIDRSVYYQSQVSTNTKN